MHRTARRLLRLLLLLLSSVAAASLASSPSAQAQSPVCARDTVGQLSVQAGVRCQCVSQPGGSITGEAAGFAWDCGILRGRMNQLVPAAPDTGYQIPPIDAVVVDPGEVPERPRNHWRFNRP